MVRGTVFCVGVFIVMKTHYEKCLNCENMVHVTNRQRPQRFCSHYCSRDFKKKIPVVGFKVNRLEIVEELYPNMGTNGKLIRMVRCLCKCGNYSIKTLTSVKSGVAKSCGCLSREHIIKIQSLFIKHNLCRHPLHSAWGAMKQRCLNPNHPSWEYYGGRGVKIYEEWINDFKSFYDWAISAGWEKGLQLDKDIKGDGFLYSPNTCCFVTKRQNSQKTRKVRYIMVNGVETSLYDLSIKFGLKRYVIIKRLKLGWDLDKTLTTPVKTKI